MDDRGYARNFRERVRRLIFVTALGTSMLVGASAFAAKPKPKPKPKPARPPAAAPAAPAAPTPPATPTTPATGSAPTPAESSPFDAQTSPSESSTSTTTPVTTPDALPDAPAPVGASAANPAPAAPASTPATPPPAKAERIVAASEPHPQTGHLEVHPTVEFGIGSTLVVGGLAFYRSKTDPATLATALIAFKNLGPGSLVLGGTHSSAVVRPTRQNGISPEFDPIVAYGIPLGDHFQTKVGYTVHIFPDLEPPDALHEILATFSLENLAVRPALEVYAEFVRLQGAYVNANISKEFVFGKVAVQPSFLVGVHGYDKPFGVIELPFALREITAAIGVTWNFASPFYCALRGSYSYTGIPHWWFENSFLGRSTPFLGLFLGASL